MVGCRAAALHSLTGTSRHDWTSGTSHIHFSANAMRRDPTKHNNKKTPKKTPPPRENTNGKINVEEENCPIQCQSSYSAHIYRVATKVGRLLRSHSQVSASAWSPTVSSPVFPDLQERKFVLQLGLPYQDITHKTGVGTILAHLVLASILKLRRNSLVRFR